MPRATALILAALVTVPAGFPAIAAEPSDYERAAARVAARSEGVPRSARKAKNVILFVGDGMGISTITAARILEGQLQGRGGEENRLSFEDFPYSALVRTYTANQQTSDSAPTATAMVTGWKANDGALSVGPALADGEADAARVEPHRLTTLLEQAEERGLATGIVTTTRITHATPASNYAHTPNRDWEYAGQLPAGSTLPDIAAQLVARQKQGDGIEVVLGGGREVMLPTSAADPEFPQQNGRRRDGRNLVTEWVDAQPASTFVWNRSDLLAVDPAKTRHLIGLFQPSHLRYEADRDKDAAGEPSLAEMTSKAIDLLKRNRKGFYLMVEGGRIDHAHHAGNAYRALTDTIAFSDAIRVAMAQTDPRDTLILVTADHSHVMTISGYPARGNPILGLVKAPGGSSFTPTAGAGGYTPDVNGQPYTTLSYANGPGEALITGSPDDGEPHPVSAGRSRDLSQVDTTAPGFHQQALVPLRSETHGGEDVALYARGPRAELVRGNIDQNEIYHILRRALGF